MILRPASSLFVTGFLAATASLSPSAFAADVVAPANPAPAATSATTVTAATPATPEVKGTAFTIPGSTPFIIPDDINGFKTVIAPPPAAKRPLSIAIYEGAGSGQSGVDNVADRAKQIPGTKITRIPADQMGTVDLSQFDIIAFSGGSGSGQAKAIGEAGRANVKKFVANGGGYLGICAGAYLATAGYDWSLGILNAKTVSPKWQRGRTFVDLEVTPEGEPIIGKVDSVFKCRYNNGPIITAMGRKDLPEFTTTAYFRSEISENDSPVGVMINSPAAAYAPFGKGRVFIISPHTENTPGLENFVPRALLWLGHADGSETVAKNETSTPTAATAAVTATPAQD